MLLYGLFQFWHICLGIFDVVTVLVLFMLILWIILSFLFLSNTFLNHLTTCYNNERSVFWSIATPWVTCNRTANNCVLYWICIDFFMAQNNVSQLNPLKQMGDYTTTLRKGDTFLHNILRWETKPATSRICLSDKRKRKCRQEMFMRNEPCWNHTHGRCVVHVRIFQKKTVR